MRSNAAAEHSKEKADAMPKKTSTRIGPPIKHGYHNTPTYHAWENMVQRATNPKHNAAGYYVERGITRCAGLSTFLGFLVVMGDRPENRLLDRWPNNAGNYSCGRCKECLKNGWALNVRWATMAESSRNKCSNVFLEVNGVKGCMADLAKHFKIHIASVRWRLSAGWAIERAFTEPPKQRISGQHG